MPDLVTIQGEAAAILSLTDIPSIEILDETAKRLDDTHVIVAAFADDAGKAAAQARGLTVTLIKTEAQHDADEQLAFAEINDTPYDFRGIA